jgi:hypothetical protein
MSTGGLSIRALSADGMPSVALQWLQMLAPPEKDSILGGGQGANSAVSVNTETNDFVRLVKDPLNLISVLGPARSGKSQSPPANDKRLRLQLTRHRYPDEPTGWKPVGAVCYFVRCDDIYQGSVHTDQDHDSA